MMSSAETHVQRLTGQFGGLTPQFKTHQASSRFSGASMTAVHAVGSPPGGSAERTGRFGPSPSSPPSSLSSSSPLPQICFALEECRLTASRCLFGSSILAVSTEVEGTSRRRGGVTLSRISGFISSLSDLARGLKPSSDGVAACGLFSGMTFSCF